jgi:DNA (cytosine-5)-methyltransferase 1
MRYLSVCSGIEAASVAAESLGWIPAAFAEVAAFPSSVLEYRFPGVPNLGDFTKIEAADVGPIDLLVGGTPCQSFSIAGQRLGLDDPRGNLTLEFFALASRLRPRWIVWENVPGVLSIDGGDTFGAILGTLGKLGYGFAYRILDAQYFGVAQRRRRVFVVGCAAGDWRSCAAVLFEPESLRGRPASGRAAGKEIAGTLSSSTGGADENDAASGRIVAQCITAGTGRRYDPESKSLIAFDYQGGGNQGDLGASLPGVGAIGTTKTPAVFDMSSITSPINRSTVAPGSPAPTLGRRSDLSTIGAGVRRLTPRECERLHGFPDDWTAIPYKKTAIAPDSLRYKAIGNSMAVPVMRWIFERIAKASAAP